MEDNTNGKKRRQPRVDRITLRPESLARLDEWLGNLQQRFRGIRVTRSDLTNWLVTSHAPELSPSELRALQSAHYDDLHFTSWALKELKAAHDRGEKLSLKDILANSRSSEAVPRRSKKKAAAETAEIPQPKESH